MTQADFLLISQIALIVALIVRRPNVEEPVRFTEATKLEPGSTVILRADRLLTAEQHTRICEWLKKAQPEVKFLVVDKSLQVESVRSSE